jgi:hypothetical protein
MGPPSFDAVGESEAMEFLIQILDFLGNPGLISGGASFDHPCKIAVRCDSESIRSNYFGEAFRDVDLV